MRIDTRIHHDVVIIQPKERITDENEAQVAEVVRAVLEAGPRRLVMDLVDVPSLDSIGLAAIVQAYTCTRRRGGDLKLLRLGNRNRQLLTITKLLTVIEAYETVDAVEQSFDVDCEESFSKPAECS